MHSFGRDERAFTGAEKALLICIALFLIIVSGGLVRRGSDKAAEDAKRTLVQGSGSPSGMGQVLPIQRAQGLPRVAPKAAPLTPKEPFSLPPGTKLSGGYEIGPPKRPDIFHDNGFLQNPNDPRDPNPIGTVSPTWGDRASLAQWELKLRLLQAAQGVPFVPHNDIRDGLSAYDHFLHGGGKDRHFDYNGFVENDEAGKLVLKNATAEMQQAAEDAYKKMIERDPSLRGKPITFQITGPEINVGGGDRNYPYPKTENWQKAIGGHAIWSSATVTVTPPVDGKGEPHFDMRLTIRAEDRYNFNPGAKDIATGTPDAENGRFEQTGLAHQYTNYGTLERDVNWNYGNTNKTTSTKVSQKRR